MFFTQNIPHKTLFRLSLATFCFAFLVIFLGAFTRLVDAGLGCPDWPGCYGHLTWPTNAQEIAEAEARFPETPVETDKTWPEMVHRYLAGSLGVLIIAIVALSLRERKIVAAGHNSPPLKLPLLLLAMVILQGAFGMWTVTLKLWPQVVTAHLLGGFATLTLLWLLVQRLGGGSWRLSADQFHRLKKSRPWLWLALLLVVLQITLGGWVSANYAALACPDLPQCLGQWLPPTNFREGFNIFQDIGPNYLGGQLDNHARTAIHLTHRIGAVLVTLIVVVLGIQLLRIKVQPVRAWVGLLWLVLLVQLALGVSNIVFVLPLAVAVGHNAVGAVLLVTLVTMVYRFYSVQVEIPKTGKP